MLFWSNHSCLSSESERTWGDSGIITEKIEKRGENKKENRKNQRKENTVKIQHRLAWRLLAQLVFMSNPYRRTPYHGNNENCAWDGVLNIAQCGVQSHVCGLIMRVVSFLPTPQTPSFGIVTSSLLKKTNGLLISFPNFLSVGASIPRCTSAMCIECLT